MKNKSLYILFAAVGYGLLKTAGARLITSVIYKNFDTGNLNIKKSNKEFHVQRKSKRPKQSPV